VRMHGFREIPTHQGRNVLPQSAGRQSGDNGAIAQSIVVCTVSPAEWDYRRFFGGGGLGVPVVSYAPRPMWMLMVDSLSIMMDGV
jgi:hypothetical protein